MNVTSFGDGFCESNVIQSSFVILFFSNKKNENDYTNIARLLLLSQR